LPRAAIAYSEAIKLKPNFAESYINLGAVLIKLNDLDGAIEKLRFAISLDPSQEQPYITLGTAYADKREFDASIAILSSATQLKSRRLRSYVYSSMANVYAERGGYDEAAFLNAKHAIQYGADPGLTYANVGIFFIDREAFAQAIRAFNLARESGLDDWRIHNNLAVALYKTKRLSDAESEYRLAITRDPSQSPPYYGLAELYIAQGRRPELLAVFREQAEKVPSARAHYNLGTMLMQDRLFEEAEIELRKSISLGGDVPDAHRNLARVLHELGREVEAMAELKIANSFVDVDRLIDAVEQATKQSGQD
jgi:tetratricopeptide (TPR) repeat protein